MPAFTHIIRPDGSLESYDESKVAHTILQATTAAGEPDQELANHMAEVVTFFLEKHFADGRPTTEDVADMIETVLLETAPPHIAKAHILRRQRHRELESTITVHKPRAGQKHLFPEDALTVELEGSAEATHWDRARIVRSLMEECDLDPNVSESVATRVEQRIFDSGLESVTTGLIRELIDVELFDMGLLEQRDRRAVVGIPLMTLEETLLRGRPPGSQHAFSSPAEVDQYITRSIFQRYALQEIHSPDVASAHVAARLNLADLGSPLRLHGLRTSLEGLKYGWPVPDAASVPPTSREEFVAHCHRYIAECLTLTNHDVVLTDVPLTLSALLTGDSDSARQSFVARFLHGLPETPRLVLQLPLQVPLAFRNAEVRGLKDEPPTMASSLQGEMLQVTRDFLDLFLTGIAKLGIGLRVEMVVGPGALNSPEVLPLVELAAECARTTGHPAFVIQRDEIGGFASTSPASLRERLLPDGLARYHEPCITTVGLNLPQAVFESRHHGLSEVEGFAGSTERLLTLARLAGSERLQFLVGSLARLEHPLLAIGRQDGSSSHPAQITMQGYARVDLVGLDDALRLLVNDAEKVGQPDELVRAGMRSLSYLAYALKDDEQTGRAPMPMLLGVQADAETSARFTRIDSRMHPALTESLLRLGASSPQKEYARGSALQTDLPPLERLMREARFHTMLNAGAFVRLPRQSDETSASTILELLKFAVHRTSARGVAWR